MILSKTLIFSFLLSFLLISGCKKTKIPTIRSQNFSEFICKPDTMPWFDNVIVKIPVQNSEILKDTIIDQIKKTRQIFKPCRVMSYEAIWKNANGENLTTGKILMTASGKRWRHQPEKQDEIIIRFTYTDQDIKIDQNNCVNQGISDHSWFHQVEEGVIENVDEVWMHPFRYNQYSFTEVAPFPQVKFPLFDGKTWLGSLKILQGWGDWTNSTGYMEYTVQGKENITTPLGNFSDCWKISAVADYPFGKSSLIYWFHEDLGFVRKEYKNYKDQTLSIVLSEIKDR